MAKVSRRRRSVSRARRGRRSVRRTGSGKGFLQSLRPSMLRSRARPKTSARTQRKPPTRNRKLRLAPLPNVYGRRTKSPKRWSSAPSIMNRTTRTKRPSKRSNWF